MDIISIASLLPRPILQYGLGGFIQIQQQRGKNRFQCQWRDYRWIYEYDDISSLTFLFSAKVTNGTTGREEISLEYFSELEKKHDAMLDLGAHMGSVAVILGVFNRSLPLYCFEPVVSNIRILRQNIQANDLNASVHESFVGSESGVSTFYEQTGSKIRQKLNFFESTVAHSSSTTKKDNPHFTPVEKRSTDIIDFCAREGILRPFLKIDIEGAEHEVMDELLHGEHGLDGFSAIVELHPDLIDNGHAHDVVLWLEEQDINIEWVKTHNPRRMALYCSTL